MTAVNPSNGSLDRTTLATAAQLLAKASSSTVDAEAVAFVEKTYRLLAQVITDYDVSCGATDFGPRRRERRLLRDRRASRLGSEATITVVNPVVHYRRARDLAPAGPQRSVDHHV